MRNLTSITIILLIFIAVDFYTFQGVRALTHHFSPLTKKILYVLYWALTVFAVTSFAMAFMGGFEKWGRIFRLITISIVFVSFFTKFFFMIFLLIDDLQRVIRWVAQKIINLFSKEPIATENPISRSEFLLKAGVAVSTIPLVGMTWGIVSGAHDYRVKKHKIVLPNLPSQFNGLKIVQISDIHSGSFYNKSAVKRGVQLILDQKPDVVFFTGDLVNNEASEMKEYISIFEKIKAPLGVYSVLGNHDYGDYLQWESPQAKRNNLNTLIGIHKQMGWDILINEHRMLERGGDKIAILGVENWGAKGRFPKYGKMDLAHKNTDDAAVKLLLSHDPSHWDAEIRTNYKDVDIMFAGHTHGMQFGIENEFIKWSPVKYMYEQWAGLYTEGNQHLYVNRGFGFIGFQEELVYSLK